MSPLFITSIIGIVISLMALGQVTPSVLNVINAKKVEIGIAHQQALFQQILRYKAINGSFPTLAQLTAVPASPNLPYFNSSDNDNEFGGSYAFTTDAVKNTVTITTTIADATSRANYIASSKHIYKPTASGSTVTTVFVIPNPTSNSNILPSSSITVSSTQPSAALNTYWYDTSGATASLKISDGVNWTAANGTATGDSGGMAPNTTNIVASASALPTTATVGDVRYIYNAATSALETLVYYNSKWNQTVVGTPEVAPTHVLTLNASLSSGKVATVYTSVDFKTKLTDASLPLFDALTITTANVTWQTQGTLPPGLTFSVAGVLSGTPTTAGTYAFSVIPTYNGASTIQSYSVVIAP